MKDKRRLSTTALSRLLSLPLKELFAILAANGWIEKKRGHWSLTLTGIENGGQFVDHPVYGKFITWPDNTDINSLGLNDRNEFMTATDIGSPLGIPGRDINHIFSELGWIQKDKKGWSTTTVGTLKGGIQREHAQSGYGYISWHRSVKENPDFKTKLKDIRKFDISGISQAAQESIIDQKEQYRTADGHYVNSAAEVIIDNWLYHSGIAHACGKKISADQPLYCSFFIPANNICIEYIDTDNARSNESLREKINTCRKLGINLIEICKTDLKHLDSVLAAKLDGFGFISGQQTTRD